MNPFFFLFLLFFLWIWAIQSSRNHALQLRLKEIRLFILIIIIRKNSKHTYKFELRLNFRVFIPPSQAHVKVGHVRMVVQKIQQMRIKIRPSRRKPNGCFLCVYFCSIPQNSWKRLRILLSHRWTLQGYIDGIPYLYRKRATLASR